MRKGKGGIKLCLQASVLLLTLKPRSKKSGFITPAFACSRSRAWRSPSEIWPRPRGGSLCGQSRSRELSCRPLGPLTFRDPSGKQTSAGTAPEPGPRTLLAVFTVRQRCLGPRRPAGSSGHPDRAGPGDCDPRWPPRQHPCDASHCQSAIGSSLELKVTGSWSRTNSHLLTDIG